MPCKCFSNGAETERPCCRQGHQLAKGFALDIPFFLRVVGVPEEAFTELFSWLVSDHTGESMNTFFEHHQNDIRFTIAALTAFC